MVNPYRLRWLKGWNFQIVLIGSEVKIEAYGFGVCLQTELRQGESPSSAADRLVIDEDRRRKSLHKSWSQNKLNIKPISHQDQSNKDHINVETKAFI